MGGDRGAVPPLTNVSLRLSRAAAPDLPVQPRTGTGTRSSAV